MEPPNDWVGIPNIVETTGSMVLGFYRIVGGGDQRMGEPTANQRSKLMARWTEDLLPELRAFCREGETRDLPLGFGGCSGRVSGSAWI